MTLHKIGWAACLLLGAWAGWAGDPTFVDLRPFVNMGREDDGIANNGKGGWTDEGINDMFVYPPIPTGPQERNGYRFELIDPAANQGRAVLLLRGRDRLKEAPREVVVPLANAKARYLYFVQNATANIAPAPANYLVATYTLTYADGSTAALPVRDGIEIHQWYTKSWWDNSGAAAWPLYMGVNLYSQKWNCYLGLWALQWENPHPELPLAKLTLASAESAVPAIWAITLADENFYEPESRRKTEFKRPGGPPDGYFLAKQAIEREGLYQEGRRLGHFQGLRSVELIRPDLLAVTVDSSLGHIAAGSGAGLIEACQKPESFRLASATDARYREPRQPAKVGRNSFERWNGNLGPFPQNILYWHTFYLVPPEPLQPGQEYTLSVPALPEECTREAKLAYRPGDTQTPALKVNQAAYVEGAGQRYAYLGWWAGDLGAVDFSDCKSFQVIDEASGKSVLEGPIETRAAADVLSGEQVGQMNLAALPRGRYHLVVPGLGRSAGFTVGEGLHDLYYHTMRAFFHQRCGQELAEPWTSFKRPACHLKVYEGGYLVGNGGYLPKPNEAVREYTGGYHDAADCDCFTYHLRATAQVLTVYSWFPNAFRDKDLNIPESGNGLPDVLDEAAWALSFYLQNQQPDGAVPLGRGNDEDYIRDWQGKHHGQRPPFGILPPSAGSSAEFAAVAAQYGKLLEPLRPADAARYLAAAERAYAWAAANPTKPKPDNSETLLLAWAAAELYADTGKANYQDDVERYVEAGYFFKYHWSLGELSTLAWWPYAACERPDVDKALQKQFRDKLLQRGRDQMKNTQAPAYRMGRGISGGGWGNLAGGGCYGYPCLLAWRLSGDAAFLDTAALNADFQLGANPLSKGFITSIGTRFPWAPQINASLYTGPGKTGQTVPGITVYGLACGKPEPQPLANCYPKLIPPWRCWRDIGGGGAEICSEFTITETIGNTAALYAFFYARAGAK